MLINADFSRAVVLKPGDRDWIASPQAGVERQMLDRIGGEVARATSIVRYIPGSTFKSHHHDLGEEFIVLDGVFADEYGSYPEGSYVRNPPGTHHAPVVPEGCTIFVKLRQFDPQDLTAVVDNLNDDTAMAVTAPGVRERVVHVFGTETVGIVALSPGARFTHAASNGAEILILSGSAGYPEKTWLRFPPGAHVSLTAGGEGARLYLKTGHLAAGTP